MENERKQQIENECIKSWIVVGNKRLDGKVQGRCCDGTAASGSIRRSVGNMAETRRMIPNRVSRSVLNRKGGMPWAGCGWCLDRLPRPGLTRGELAPYLGPPSGTLPDIPSQCFAHWASFGFF